MAKKPSEPTTALVLSDIVIGATSCRCGDVVRAPAPLIASYVSIGVLDPHPAAVAYALEQGATEREV